MSQAKKLKATKQKKNESSCLLSPYDGISFDIDPFGAQYLFKYLLLSQIFVYMEAGVVPSLLEQFKITFSLTPQLLGLLGAIVYITLSIATPLVIYLFRTKSARFVLGWSLVCNAIGLLLFAFTPVGYSFSTTFFILSRGIIGFSQAFLSVFAPLWIHEYCPKEGRASSMGYLQASIPIGVTFGYFIGSIAIWCSKKPAGCYFMLCWRWPLLFPLLGIIPIALCTFFIPKKHILIMDDHWKFSSSSYTGLVKLLSQPVFTSVVLGLSAVFFVVTGIQYWVTLFLSTNTNDSAYVVHIGYIMVAGTGPILGLVFGGWLIDATGGYTGAVQEAKALGICLALGSISALAAIPPSFLSDTYSIGFFLWIMLFCGGSVLPACSGIVISSVPTDLRPLASSVAATSYNLLGFAASNYIPGLIMSFVVVDNAVCDQACLYRLGFRVVLAWSLWAVLFIFAAWRCSCKKANM